MNKSIIAICAVILVSISITCFAQDGNKADSPFADTTWENHGTAVSTLTFKADGGWSEEYAPHPLHGYWKLTKDKNVVEVDILNGKVDGHKVIHFAISDDGKTCTRVESKSTWEKK